MRLDGWRFQSHPDLLGAWERRGAGDWVQLPKASDFINHACVRKPPWNPKGQGSENVHAGEHAETCPERACKPFQHSFPCALLHWPFICTLDDILQYPSHKLLSVSKWFSEFCEALTQISHNWGGGRGNLRFAASPSAAWVMSWIRGWLLRQVVAEGAGCGAEPLTCRIRHHLQTRIN